MPPFVLPVRTVTLVFDKGPLVGLEVEAWLDLSIDSFMELTAKFNKAVNKKTGWQPVQELMAWFGEHVASAWNLHEQGELVPLTPAAFTAKLSGAQGLDIVARYIMSLRGTNVPLSQRSASGGTSRGRRASKNPPS